MTQDIDLQAQMEGESDRAYLSYQTYRDMGVSRSMPAAYTAYLKEIDKFGLDQSRKVSAVSKTFRQWAVDFSWDDRVRDWDNGHAKRIQEKLLAADQEKYINSVEKLRSEVETVSKELMETARISNAIALRQISGIASKIGKQKAFESMPKELLREHSEHTATAINAAKILVIASDKLSEALGLERIIEGLNNAKDSE
jgi:hypothetical protein